MRAYLEINLPDDWEPGYCEVCPLHYEENSYDEDDGWDSWAVCVLGENYKNCPLYHNQEKSKEEL